MGSGINNSQLNNSHLPGILRAGFKAPLTQNDSRPPSRGSDSGYSSNGYSSMSRRNSSSSLSSIYSTGSFATRLDELRGGISTINNIRNPSKPSKLQGREDWVTANEHAAHHIKNRIKAEYDNTAEQDRFWGNASYEAKQQTPIQRQALNPERTTHDRWTQQEYTPMSYATTAPQSNITPEQLHANMAEYDKPTLPIGKQTTRQRLKGLFRLNEPQPKNVIAYGLAQASLVGTAVTTQQANVQIAKPMLSKEERRNAKLDAGTHRTDRIDRKLHELSVAISRFITDSKPMTTKQHDRLERFANG